MVSCHRVQPEENPQSNDSDAVDVVENDNKRGCLICGEFQLILTKNCFSLLAQLGAVLILCDQFKSLFNNNSSLSAQTIIGLILSYLQFCSMPITIINNFSVIIRDRNAFKKTLIKYGAGVLGTLLVFIYIYFRFLIPLIKRITNSNTSEACDIADLILSLLFTYLRQINIFVDIFICILIAFFLLYYPKTVFIGKRIIYFRLLTIFPIAWCIAGYVLLALNQKGVVFPGYLYPLVPLKPPMLLLAIISMTIYLRVKENKFLKENDLENLDSDFMTRETNRAFNSFISKVFLIASVLDFGMILVFIFSGKEVLISMGFGGACLIWLIIPIIKMLDFRKADESKLSLLIPFIFFGLIVYMWIEAIYWMANFLVDYIKEMFFSSSESSYDYGNNYGYDYE